MSESLTSMQPLAEVNEGKKLYQMLSHLIPKPSFLETLMPQIGTFTTPMMQQMQHQLKENTWPTPGLTEL